MIGACIFITKKGHLRSDVDGLIHTKQLLNLFCIVYTERIISGLIFNIFNNNCYCWQVTGMTETGVTKSMQTHTYFDFWKQTLLNIYTIILRHINLICFFLDFNLFAAYTFYRNMGNKGDRLPVCLTTYFS